MSRFLQYLNDCLKTCDFPMTRITEIHNGISETLEVSAQNPCQNCYSVAKTFTMTAIGLLYDKGLLRTDDRLCDILSDELPESGMDERWHTVTVDMLLTHSAGLPGGFLDIDINDANGFGTDYLGYLFRASFVRDPAGEPEYTDGAYYLLARVVENLCGESVDDLLWRELFAPLHFREAAWSHCPQGHVIGATGLYARSGDVVKLGELYRCGGMFDGKRIISEDWVNTVLQRGYELQPIGFGDAYGKGGMCGQMLAVFPSKKLSVCWTSYNMNLYSGILGMIEES